MKTILVFIGLLQLAAPQTDADISQQSKEQAKQYIEHIHSGENTNLHLWSLSALLESNPDLKNDVAVYINSSSKPSDLLEVLLGTSQSQAELLQQLSIETGSLELLIASLLQAGQNSEREHFVSTFRKTHPFSTSSSTNFDLIIQTILKGDKVDASMLPVENNHFLHFLFLYKGINYLSSGYLQSLTSHWSERSLNPSTPSLKKSMLQAALVRANFILDQHQKNLELYDQLINDQLLPNSSYRLNTYRALDYSVYRLGYYDKSLHLIRTFTVPISRYLNRSDVELNALMSQATSLYNIGKIKESQLINLEVFKTAQEKNIAVKRSTLYNNLGISYWQSGEYNKYLEWQFKALEIAENDNNISHQLSILKNLYIYYISIKEKESAKLYLDKAMQLTRESKNQKDLASVFALAGEFQRDINQNFPLALKNFLQAESYINRESDYILFKDLLYEKAKLYEEYRNLDSTLAQHKKIQEISLEKENTSSYLEALTDEARIYLKTSNLEQASSVIAEITSLSLEESNFTQIVKAKTVEANYLSKIDEEEKAYQILHPVIEQVVPRAKKSTSLESGFWNIEPEYLEAFDVMVNLLLKTNRHKKAVEILDELKTINDPALYQNPMVKSSLLNESELTQYERLTNELDALRRQQLVASEDRKPVIKTRIDRLNVQKQALDQKISKLATRSSVSVNDIQNKITGSEIVLHITELNDWFYIGKITRRNTQITKVKLDSTNRSLFKNAITNLSNGDTNLDQLHKISKLLKIEEIPEWITTLTIIPDSYLFELPIDILPLKKPSEEYSYGEATYLVERFNTHYVTSISDFITDTPTASEHKFDFAGYGISNFDKVNNKNLVPLPFAKSEINNITDNLTSLKNRRSFVDSESSESAFKSSAPQAKILHLATHSEISEQDPLYSTIYMSPENESPDTDFPGQIFAYELFELNLNNEMIMLNSCESGSGSYLQGTGIMGISRALRYAGAKSLVLNLWSVNDMMASEFAIKFYDYLNQGKSKTEALQLTKVHFIKEKNANPHFWGPYMLIGDESPIIKPYEDTNLYLAASFMLYFVLFVAFSLFKKQNQSSY